MTAKTKTLLPGHRVSVRAGTASKWVQDATIDLAPGDSLIVNGQVVVPPVTPPPPTGKVVPFPGSGARTPAAFLALAADATIDVIEWAAGTYPWVCFLNVARTRPLLVRPIGDVIWDGGGNGDPAWRIGWGGFASNITFDPSGTGRFLAQNYNIGLAGLVMARYYDHIAMNGVIVRNVTGTASPQTTHVVYLDSDGTHRGKSWTSNDWDIVGPANRYLNGLHLYHDPGHDGVQALRWKVKSLHRAVYAYSASTGIDIGAWEILDCDGTIDTGGTAAQGVVHDCHAVNAGPMAPGQGYWTAGSRLTSVGNTVA